MIDTRNKLDMRIKEDRDKSNKILVDYFLEIIDRTKPTCIIEIGAFSAEFSRKLREINKNLKIFAFEANTYNFDVFSNKYDFKERNINYINKAISDKNEVITFNIQKKINEKEVSPIRGNNSILERNQINTEYEEVYVESTSLSCFIEQNSLENEKISLWIDVEGANQQVLKGCEKVLNKINLIFIEVEEKEFWKEQWLESDVNEFMSKNNFTLIARDGEYEKQYNQIYINNSI